MTLNHNTIVTKSGLTFNTDQQGGKFSPSPLNSLSSKDIFSLSTSALAIGEVQKHDPVFNLNPLLLENHNLNFTEEHPTGEKTLDQIFSWHKTAAIDNAAPSNVTPPQGVTQKDLINFSNSSYEPLIFIKPFQNNFGDYQPGKIYNTLDVANFEPPVSNEVKIFYEAATDAEFAQAAGLKTELESLSKFDFKDIASDTLPSLTAEVHNERLIQHAPVTEITVPVVTHPQANPDINSYTEGTSINPTGNVLINDNANNNVLVVSNPGTYQGTYGTLILNANGSYTYIHKDPSSHPETQNALNTLGDHQDVFTYGLDNGNTSTLTIKIIPIEFTPVMQPQANPDTNSYVEGSGTPVTGNVLSNDDTNRGGDLTVSNPGTYVGTYGDLTLNQDGTYTYAPHDPSTDSATLQALNTAGPHQDVFNYTDTNASGAMTSSTITVTIATNPHANADTNSYTEDSSTSVTGNVLSNDNTNNGGDLTVSNPGTYTGTYGDLTLNQDGTYTYTPHDPSTDSATLQALNTPGVHQDVFNYIDINASGATTSSTITVTIATNPHANPDTNSYTEGSGTPVTGNVLSNDDTNRGGDLTVSNPGTYVGTYGDLTLNQDGTYTYMPHDPSTDPATLQALNTAGPHQDVFNYTDTNASGAMTSSTITVTIATNPHANADTNSYTEGSGTPVTGNVLSNDDTNRGGDLRVTNPGTYTGTYGDLTLNQDGTYTYTPHDPSTDSATLQALNTPGVHQDVFNYIDINASGATTSSTITVTIATNPHANADTNSYTEGSGTPVTGNVLSNDDTNRGGDLTVSNPGTYVGTYGDLTLNQDGTYTYMPHDPSSDSATLQALNTPGVHQDVFNYTDTNASGAMTSSTLTINIDTNPVTDIIVREYTEDLGTPTSVVGNVLSDALTNNGGDLMVKNPGTYTGTYGDLTLNQDGTYTYMPHDPSTDPATLQALNTPGTHQDEFTYIAINANEDTSSSTLIVRILTMPEATPESYGYVENTDTTLPFKGNVLTNDSSNNGGDLTVSNPGTYTGTYGDLTLKSDGAYAYMPYDPATNSNVGKALDVPGTHQDVFNYTDTNASGATTSSTLTFYISSTIKSNFDYNSYIENSNTLVTGNVLDNDLPYNSGTLMVENPGVYKGTYGDLTLNEDGSYVYTPHDPSTDPDTLQALNKLQSHQDSFYCTVFNNSAGQSASDLIITIGTNPQANPDTNSYTEGSGTPVTGNVLTNDDTNKGGSLFIANQITYIGTYGIITINQDGSYTVAPNDFSNATEDENPFNNSGPHTDQVSYTAVNADGVETKSMLTITYTTNPQANPDTNSYTEGSNASVTGNVLDNDILNGSTLSVKTSINYEGTYGTVVINTDGSYVVTPKDPNTDPTVENAFDDIGPYTDQISYTAVNADGVETSSILTITYEPGAPTAKANSYNFDANDVTPTDDKISTNFKDINILTDEDPVAGADLDPQGNSVYVQEVLNASLVIAGNTIKLTPTSGGVASYSFDYTGHSGYFTISSDGQVTLTGEFSLKELAMGQDLIFSFDYENENKQGLISKPAHVDLTVHGVNDAPITKNVDISVMEDNTYVFTLNDFPMTDIDGDRFNSLTLKSLPMQGQLFLDNTLVTEVTPVSHQQIEAGLLTFKPAPNGNGDKYAQFEFTVSDGQAESNLGTLNIHVTPVDDDATLSVWIEPTTTNEYHLKTSVNAETAYIEVHLSNDITLDRGNYNNDTSIWTVQASDLSDLKITGNLSSSSTIEVKAISIDNISSEQQIIQNPSFLNNITLSDNLGDHGFKIAGQANADLAGSSVSNAGDINGDGIDDLIIGAEYNSTNGSSSGAAYVIYGGKDLSNITLSDNLGDHGFKITGQANADLAGSSVSNAGDINGDGIDDLIVGAEYNSTNGSYSGAAYVIYGGKDLSNITLSDNLSDHGFKITGQDAYNFAGSSVSNAGDINGDGIDDLIIGAERNSTNGSSSGAAYVIYGGKDLSNITLSDNLSDHGFKITGQDAYNFAGSSVSNAGDINGDGIDDLIIGAGRNSTNGSYSGAAYVIYGGKDLSNITLSDNLSDHGFKITGQDAYNFAGRSVSNAGDINGDGIDDLIVGAEYNSTNGSSSGAAYVIYGGKDLSNITLSDNLGDHGFKITGQANADLAGSSVSNAGDINGDGIDDLIIGAERNSTNGSSSGAAYVIYGGKDLSNITLSDNLSDHGFKITGQDAYDFAGSSVSNAGDINGDGIDDLIIGAEYNSTNGSSSGATYVIYGKDTTVSQYISGSNDDSVLIGSLGNDALDGRGGNDTLTGDLGNDILTGGTGYDTFVFDLQNGFGHDIIKDFDINADILQFKHVTQIEGHSQIDSLLKMSEVVKGTDNSMVLKVYQDTNMDGIFGNNGDTEIGTIKFANLSYGSGNKLTDYIDQAHIKIDG